MSYFRHNKKPGHRLPDFRHNDGLAHFPEVKVVYTGDSQEERDAALDKALNIFKKIVARDGVLQELKDRASFKSDSQKEHDRVRQREYKQNLKKEKKGKFFKPKKY